MPTESQAPQSRVRPPDIYGAARLAVDATVGIVDLVEDMHHTIAARAGIFSAAPSGRTSGITGLVYRTIRGAARLTGTGIDTAWDTLAPEFAAAAPDRERDAVIAALNGVCGDHLAATGNKLAIPMQLRAGRQALGLDATSLRDSIKNPSSHLIVLVHGLCLTDAQWCRRGHDHGQALARDLGASTIYLHYNTGCHISENGAEFAPMLDALVTNWPVSVEQLTIIGHSMGGLVARSACLTAETTGARWPSLLRTMIFLGTPHHGAPPERGGMLIDKTLGLSPYIAPFARLGKARSAGITDLRFGNVQQIDWQIRDRHSQHHDDRAPAPLPNTARAFAVAATLGDTTDGLSATVLGDGLVPIASALGEHPFRARTLGIPHHHKYLALNANHFDLLNRNDVYQQLRAWLAD
jgi:pimeloyl-ACP methyl ester carboxylesterase